MDSGNRRNLDAVVFVTLYGGCRSDRPDFGLEKTVEKEDAR